MRAFPFKANHYSPLRSEYFVAVLISFGSVELLLGSVTDLWLCVSPHQQIVSAFNKTEVRDYTEDCVGIKSNASCGFCDYHAISKTSSDTTDEIFVMLERTASADVEGSSTGGQGMSQGVLFGV